MAAEGAPARGGDRWKRGLQTNVYICEYRRVPEQEPPPVCITLTPMQVREVVRAAAGSRSPTLATLIADSLAAPRESREAPTAAGAEHPGAQTAGPLAGRAGTPAAGDVDPRLSRSLVRGLAILTRFGPDAGERGIVELAGELDMSPSTAHRYAQTLVQLGL